MKIISKMDNFFIRLGLFILYWGCFVTYQIVKGVNTGSFNTFGFIYACMIYLPFTLLILLDKFHFAHILIIIVFALDGFTSIGTLIKNIQYFGNTEITGVHVFSILLSVVSFVVSIFVIILCIMKLKKDLDKEVEKEDNKIKTFILCVGILALVKISFNVYNLFAVINDLTSSLDVCEKIFSMVYNTSLLILEIIYIISSKKKNGMFNI